ncbi:MAG: hypothetical protein AB1938_23955 [Myxococcota bacterium]
MRRLLLAVSVVLAGCGGGGTPPPDSNFTCSSVPTCYSDALAALKACVPNPALTLNPVTPNSGVIDGLTCTAGPLTVAFSTFSERPTGTVPLPSGVTFRTSGADCAVVGRGVGSSTSGGATRNFEFASIKGNAPQPVHVRTYSDGTIGIACSQFGDEVTAAPGTLSACPTAVIVPKVTRNDAVTQMGMDLVDVSGAKTVLFTCQ